MRAGAVETLRGRTKLVAVRIHQGVTQGTVARCAGVSNATICLLEAGGRARKVTITKVERGYARALGQAAPGWISPSTDRDETEIGTWMEAQIRAFIRDRFPENFTGPEYRLTIEDLKTLVRATIYVWRPRERPRPRKER